MSAYRQPNRLPVNGRSLPALDDLNIQCIEPGQRSSRSNSFDGLSRALQQPGSPCVERNDEQVAQSGRIFEEHVLSVVIGTENARFCNMHLVHW